MNPSSINSTYCEASTRLQDAKAYGFASFVRPSHRSFAQVGFSYTQSLFFLFLFICFFLTPPDESHFSRRTRINPKSPILCRSSSTDERMQLGWMVFSDLGPIRLRLGRFSTLAFLFSFFFYLPDNIYLNTLSPLISILGMAPYPHVTYDRPKHSVSPSKVQGIFLFFLSHRD